MVADAGRPRACRTPETTSRRGPAGFRHGAAAPHAELRTFHPRRSVLGATQRDALDRLWPVAGFTLLGPEPLAPRGPGGWLSVATLFGRSAPLVVEIGPGMGEATAAMAAADPDRDYLAIEAHLPGVAQLLVLGDSLGLTNLRVAFGDAVQVLTAAIAPSSVDALHIFFPDPWPKARHHKRRLVQASRVGLLRSRLVPGGTIHCATDWAPYAEAMLAAFATDAELVNPYGGPAPRPADRPVTRFEQRALDAGRAVVDVLVRRTDSASAAGTRPSAAPAGTQTSPTSTTAPPVVISTRLI